MPPKRASAEKRAAAHDEEDEEMHGEDGEADETFQRPTKKARGKGKARKDDEEMDEGEGEDEESMSQMFDGTQAAETGAVAGLAGVVDYVEMWNFMTYTHQKVVLGPNINFIYGRNGSGKSSVLAALIVALGGKSSATDRGSSVKGLIKNGTTNAKIAIAIHNTGSEAYQHAIYGDKIIIERYLANGSGKQGYEIRNAKRAVKATSKEEVLRITDHFNIQVENPLCILTQEMSKSFIRTSSDEEKYKFFLMGTQLDRMNMDYEECLSEREVMVEILTKKRAGLPMLEDEVKEVERRYEECTKLRDMEDNLEKLKNEMIWAEINEQERELEAVDNKLKIAKDELPKVRAKVEEKKKALSEKEEEVASIAFEMKDVDQDINRISSEQEALLKAAKAKRKEVTSLQAELRNATAAIKELERERDEKLGEIASVRSSTAKNKGAEQEKLARDIQRLESDLQNVRKETKICQGVVADLDQKISSLNDGSFQRQRDLTNTQQAITSIRNRIKNINASKQNRLRVFGEDMPAIVAAIDAEKGWHKKPIAPLGSYIQLKDKSWALAVEKTIGSVLSSIAVHDSHDFQLLRNIFKKVCRYEDKYPQCIMLKITDRVYDDYHRECASVPGCPTVMDVITVTHPHVTNCLIDQTKIHQTVLFKRLDHARKVVFGSDVAWLSTGYTMEGDQVKPGGRWYSNKERDRGSRLTEDFDEQIEHLDAELKAKMDEEKRLTGIAGQQRADLDAAKQAIDKERKKLKALQTRMHALEGEIQDRQVSMQDEEVVDTREDEDRVRYLGEQIEEARVRAQQLQQVFDTAKSQTDPEMKQISQLDNQMTKFRSTLDALIERQAQASSQRDHHRQALEKHDRRRMELEREVQDYSAVSEERHRVIDDQRHKAEEKGFRYVKTNKNPADLDRKITALSARLSKEQRVHGNVDEVAKELKQKKEAYQEADEMLKSMEMFIDEMQKAVELRIKNYKTFRAYMAKRVQIFFITLLKQKRFEGKIRFDHTNAKLELEVMVDASRAKSDGREAKTSALSGGERSFSTICMLMALWEAMEAPFYCMDEFDVCMDAVTRRISLGMLLDTARQKKDHQYVFLTPNSLEDISKDDGVDVRFHRLVKDDVPANQPTMDGYLAGQAE